jgi:hypothetical protein
METQIGTERILVFENLAEIQRITDELKTRLEILNSLNNAGLSPDEIKVVTASQTAIDSYIFDLHLKGNKKLFDLHKAGIKVNADMPNELQRLKYTLTAWFNYRMAYSGSNKYSGLVHDGEAWQIDKEQLESHFLARGIKVYVEGEQLDEYHDIENLCKIIKRLGMYHGQVKDSSFLNARIENTVDGLKVRGSFFRK